MCYQLHLSMYVDDLTNIKLLLSFTLLTSNNRKIMIKKLFKRQDFKISYAFKFSEINYRTIFMLDAMLK